MISVSFLIPTPAYALPSSSAVVFWSVQCNSTCTVQRVWRFGVSGVNAVSFVHQSKGGESPLGVSFRPSGSGIGLKPLAPFYQALSSWQEFFERPSVIYSMCSICVASYQG